jgi:hypothetical protein
VTGCPAGRDQARELPLVRHGCSRC